MAAGDGWVSRLITGLAEHLAAAGIGVWRPPPGAVYASDEIGILYRSIPAVPDRIVTLAPYVVTGASPSNLADITIGVQARIRGTTDPRSCDDIADAIFDLLDSSGRQTWGTAPVQVSIVDVWRQSYGSLGDDANGRWETSHNYYVQAMRPTAHRTD